MLVPVFQGPVLLIYQNLDKFLVEDLPSGLPSNHRRTSSLVFVFRNALQNFTIGHPNINSA
jgi:hypothetical protein